MIILSRVGLDVSETCFHFFLLYLCILEDFFCVCVCVDIVDYFQFFQYYSDFSLSSFLKNKLNFSYNRKYLNAKH